ncbi:MAG: tRNA adenosine(34) deaminase TadA [Phycisphaeraceae bacterium]
MPTPVDTTMMQRALTLAHEAAAAGEVPVGAVIYRGEEIVGEAHNSRETDTDPTAHAEIVALRRAAARLGTWRMDECAIAVTLEPCPMCAGALVNARMGRLIYGAADAKMGAVDTLYAICTDARLNHRLTVVPGVMAEACVEVLQAFFQARRGSGPSKPRRRGRARSSPNPGS